MTLRDINYNYYSQYEELYRARTTLPPKQYEAMASMLYAEYRQDVERYINNMIICNGQADYSLRFRTRTHVPRGHWIFKNKMAKRLDKELRAELKTLLSGLPDVAPEPEPAPITEEVVAEPTTALAVIDSNNALQ